MENASKALLMAGGILIALLVIGLLVIMFNQIGDYGNSQNANKKDSEIAKFNLDFERYLDDKGITGADVISLYNKINDYNQKTVDVNAGKDAENSIDYSIKIELTVSNIMEFNDIYASSLFTNDTYTITGSNVSYRNNELCKELDKGKIAESIGDLTANQLKELSKYKKNEIEKKYQEIINDETKMLTYNQIEAIKNYRAYWEFKTAKFMPDNTGGKAPVDYASNGQINKINVRFDK